MHIPDGLLSTPVAASLCGVAGVTLAMALRRNDQGDDDLRSIPQLAALSAFIFAAQMVNFPVFAGVSGHLAGAVLAALLVGPLRATLVMFTVLAIQALFFSDGGLLALGANLVNMGIVPAFVGYGLYQLIAGKSPSKLRQSLSVVCASTLAIVLSSVLAFLQIMLSGYDQIDAVSLLSLLSGLHLLIGLAEGVITLLVFNWLRESQEAPQTVSARERWYAGGGALLLASAIVAGGLSWFASSHEDGFEASLSKSNTVARFDEGLSGVFGDYSLSLENAFLDNGLAGLLGVVLALGLGWLLTRVASTRRRRLADA